MSEEDRKECPMCASRNISFSEREHALVCRDCGNVVTGTPVKLELPKEEAVEIIHEKTPIIKKPAVKKVIKKKAKKAAKKPKKKAKKKVIKKKAAKKKPSKSKKKKSLLKRLLRR